YTKLVREAHAYAQLQHEDSEDNLSSQEVAVDLLKMCSEAIKSEIDVWKAKRDEADAAKAHFLQQFSIEFDRNDNNTNNGDGDDEEHRKRRRLQFESTIPDPLDVKCVVCFCSGGSQSFMTCGHVLCTQCLKEVVVTSHKRGERNPQCHLCRVAFREALVSLPVELKYCDQFVQVPLKVQGVEIYLDTRHALKPFVIPSQGRFGRGRFRVVPFGLRMDEGVDCGDLEHWGGMVVEKEASKVWGNYLVDVKDYWEAELRAEVVVVERHRDIWQSLSKEAFFKDRVNLRYKPSPNTTFENLHKVDPMIKSDDTSNVASFWLRVYHGEITFPFNMLARILKHDEYRVLLKHHMIFDRNVVNQFNETAYLKLIDTTFPLCPESGNAHNLAQALMGLLGDPDIRNTLTPTVFQHMIYYRIDWDHIVRRSRNHTSVLSLAFEVLGRRFNCEANVRIFDAMAWDQVPATEALDPQRKSMLSRNLTEILKHTVPLRFGMGFVFGKPPNFRRVAFELYCAAHHPNQKTNRKPLITEQILQRIFDLCDGDDDPVQDGLTTAERVKQESWWLPDSILRMIQTEPMSQPQSRSPTRRPLRRDQVERLAEALRRIHQSS
ncbi:hypothetical protein HK102_008745, partial [Quaeritorhiza haematococci]